MSRKIIGIEKYTTHGKEDPPLEADIYRLSCTCGNNTFYIHEVNTGCPGCGHGPHEYQVCTKCGKTFDE